MSDVLIELCAGSAAISLRWLHPTAAPPIAYQGGKRAYASSILLAAGLRPGGGARDARVVLVEPGPWGEAWAEWRTAEGRLDTIDRLRAWSERDPRELWREVAAQELAGERRARVAAWAVLQWWSFGRKPITTKLSADGGWWAWRTHGFDNTGAYRSTVAAAKRAAGDLDYDIGVDQRLPLLVARLEGLPDLSCVEVAIVDARLMVPIPGAIVVIDPPYQGTTNVYGADLPRADVLALATRWREAGATVVVCEAEPLPLAGWHPHRLPPPHGRGRTFSRQQSEYLTLSAPPVGVLPWSVEG